jgi:hypothetical protein
MTLASALAKLANPLDKYDLRNKNKSYDKDESSNLNIMTSALKFVIKCEALGLEENFKKTCLGYAFFRACQYAISDEKVCKGFKYVSIKFAYAIL